MLQPKPTNHSSTLNRLQGLVRVVMINDLTPEAKQVETELPYHGVKLDSVETLEEAIKKIRSGNFDAVLLCTSKTSIDPIEAIRTIRVRSRNLPIVVLSDKDDKALALETLKSGAQDYLLKTKVKNESIARCLRYAIERQRIRYEILLEGERSTRLILENSLQAFLAMD